MVKNHSSNTGINKEKREIDNKKARGKYYTPDFIIDYILKNTISNTDIIKKPFIKIIDPSCGSGFFLLAAYDVLKDLFNKNINKLKEEYSSRTYDMKINGKPEKLSGFDYWREENIHYHILTHCIYGADIDSIALEKTREELRKKNPSFQIEDLNIVECDSLIPWEKLDESFETKIKEKTNTNKLFDFWSNKYDFVIGNPPYIGQKNLDLNYKAWLLREYKDVFRDKADISFCFFKRIKDILAPGGICGIISSRYFMESPNGRNLRKYLMENVKIKKIVDFYGENIFKGLGVATAIYIFELKKSKEENYYIDIHKLREENIKNKRRIDIEDMIKTNQFDNFNISFKRLDLDRWMIIPDELYSIYKKIDNKTYFKLKDLADSFQGIITGFDSAFVVNCDQIVLNQIEGELVKLWIKNKDIEKYYIQEPSLSLIYSNNIRNLLSHPKSIDYISRYREKLEKRRECKKGIRKWYHLQWGREESLFNQEKIVFPYKSNTNKFAIDYDNLFFSADIYGLILKEDYRDKISHEYLIGILNSNVYEFYFKLFGKKMGKDIYDYYPNSVLELKIITDDVIDSIEELSKQIIFKKDSLENLKEKIDKIIMDYFNFNDKERNIIRRGL